MLLTSSTSLSLTLRIDARYRHALANFTHFISSFVPLGAEADYSLPHLPAKDLIQRIYRDVRFSKDKTPYKTHLSASHCTHAQA